MLPPAYSQRSVGRGDREVCALEVSGWVCTKASRGVPRKGATLKIPPYNAIRTDRDGRRGRITPSGVWTIRYHDREFW